MSRIGKKPIVVPKGVNVTILGNCVSVQGPKGKLEEEVPVDISVTLEDGKILVRRPNDERPTRARQGLVRALVNNMVKGVSEGFERALEIGGVGYRAELKGRTLVLHLGFSHPVEFAVPSSVEVVVEKPTRLIVRGADRQAVGAAAAKIRSFRQPDPYKAKGVTYAGEVIRRKAGKKAIGT